MLRSGDEVEILTTENGQPQKEWLSFVRTKRAKDDIQSFFKTSKDGKISLPTAAEDPPQASVVTVSLTFRSSGHKALDELIKTLEKVPGVENISVKEEKNE